MPDPIAQIAAKGPSVLRAAEAAYDTYWLALVTPMTSAYPPWRTQLPEHYLAWCEVVEAVLDLHAHGQV